MNKILIIFSIIVIILIILNFLCNKKSKEKFAINSCTVKSAYFKPSAKQINFENIVNIGVTNTSSSLLLSLIDSFILLFGYKISTKFIYYDNDIILKGLLDNNKIDYIPEIYVKPSMEKQIKDAINSNKIILQNNKIFNDYGEKWFVNITAYERHPEIKNMTVLEIIEHPEWFTMIEYFDTYKKFKIKEKGKGIFCNSPYGSKSHFINKNLFKAFDMEKKGWILYNPKSIFEYDKIIKSSYKQNSKGNIKNYLKKRKKISYSWFGYSSEPNNYIMESLKYGFKNDIKDTNLRQILYPVGWGIKFDKKNWNCISNIDCSNFNLTSWIKPKVLCIINKNFENHAHYKVVNNYLSKRVIPKNLFNKFLHFLNHKYNYQLDRRNIIKDKTFRTFPNLFIPKVFDIDFIRNKYLEKDIFFNSDYNMDLPISLITTFYIFKNFKFWKKFLPNDIKIKLENFIKNKYKNFNIIQDYYNFSLDDLSDEPIESGIVGVDYNNINYKFFNIHKKKYANIF